MTSRLLQGPCRRFHIAVRSDSQRCAPVSSCLQFYYGQQTRDCVSSVQKFHEYALRMLKMFNFMEQNAGAVYNYSVCKTARDWHADELNWVFPVHVHSHPTSV